MDVDPEGMEILPILGSRDPRIEQIGLLLKEEIEAEGLLGGRLCAESLTTALAISLIRDHSSLGRKAARACYELSCGWGAGMRVCRRTGGPARATSPMRGGSSSPPPSRWSARTPFSAATTRLPEVFDAPRWIVRAGGYNQREVLCEYPLEWARGTPRKRGAEPEKGFD